MSRHMGIHCMFCKIVNFTGRRHKCLQCYNYNLCGTCYEAGYINGTHLRTHPMQCILTKNDFDIYYGGETLKTTSMSQSFTCPYCGRMGFTDASLEEHVHNLHYSSQMKVLCPLCASVPGTNSNFTTDDLSGHLVLHNTVILDDEDETIEIIDPVTNIAAGPIGEGRIIQLPVNSDARVASTSPILADIRNRFLSLISEEFQLNHQIGNPKRRNLPSSTNASTSTNIPLHSMPLINHESNSPQVQAEQPTFLLNELFEETASSRGIQISPEQSRFIRELVVSSFEQLSTEERENLLREESLLNSLKSKFNVDLN